MALTGTDDYKAMLKHARKKAVPEVITISMAELKKHEEGDDDESSSDEETAKKKKKTAKNFEPMEEEVEQIKLIAKLTAQWKCEDRRQCKRTPCFPDRVSAKHVHLTHFHLSTWSAAIQGKHVNTNGKAVDLKNPPDDKLFEFQEAENDDTTLIRNRATQKATAKDSNITINLTLPDTAALPLPLPAQPLRPIQESQPCRIAPQITLELFCLPYNLSQGIHTKLRAYSVTGPQTLHHLKNNHLEAALLNPAEIADVRDAQDRWIMGEGEYINLIIMLRVYRNIFN
ncbi:hypothetical protein C8R43DRAFT_945370 [Mycena crocata]|nr:hypothetical protein C8R43DRAFT_945370 [Mycena crocata]